MTNPTKSSIYYLCPDIQIKSAGIRRLYRHVDILRRTGFDAHILHMKNGFRRADMPDRIPVRYLDQHHFRHSDIIVIPEGFPALMHALKDQPGRRFAIALNWDYIFKSLPPGMDWRDFGIERVITVSPEIGKLVSWSMDLPVHVLSSSIDRDLYYSDGTEKHPSIIFISRKAPDIDILKSLLATRNPDFINNIEWVGFNGVPEPEYAAQIRKAAVFLNLSRAEGFPTSCLEAMASATLVAGYDSIGGRGWLIGDGKGQNCVLAPNGDYISLAYQLEPVLDSLLKNQWARYVPLLKQALKTVAGLTPDNEAKALLSFWHEWLVLD